MEDDLFITRHQDKKEISYYGERDRERGGGTIITLSPSIALNRPDVKDSDMTYIKDVIVDSLFSVFVTAGETQLP